MKRALALATLLLCVGALSATAGPRGRTVEKPYEWIDAGYTVPPGQIYGRISNHVHLQSRAGERFVMVAIEDATGTTVPAVITQDVDGDGEADTEADFCGATEKPVAIEPGVELTVSMQHGFCDGVTGAFGAFTEGTITATFSR